MQTTAPSPATPAANQPGSPTMAELLALMSADGSLARTRRANVTSSVRRFCQALGCEPAEAPATFWWFRDRLKTFHPLEAGIAKKRWMTIKSDVTFALRRAGMAPSQPKPRAPHTEAWRVFKAALGPGKFVWGLSHFALFCGQKGIAPTQVDDAIIEAYGTVVREETFKSKPERRLRALAVLWNKVVERSADTSLKKVTIPSHREVYSPKWEALPATFRVQAEHWLQSLGDEVDLLSDEARIKPLRKGSIATYRHILRMIAGALMAKGTPIETMTSLSAFVDGDAPKTALRFFVDRNHGERSSSIANVAHVLVLIARDVVHVSPEALEKLKVLRKRLSVQPRGMKSRPKNALRPFVDQKNIEKILLLSQQIHARLKKKKPLTLADARLMQVAVALELLLMRPIRRQNLVDLRLGEHVLIKNDAMFVVIQAEDVKNSVELDYLIPGESAKLVEFYIKKVLPLFGPNPKGWLFPGDRPERPKSPEQFGRNFTRVVREATGLSIYPHLMRHFGATLYLREHPGAFEIMRRVLGHKSLTTTTQSYASFEDDAAVRLYDQLVLRIRDTINREVGNA